MRSLQGLLDQGIVVADGAMGTILQEQGIPFEHPYPYANVTHPDVVQDVHAAYVRAGARIVETNTYGANRLKLALSRLEDRVWEINQRGAELARRAAGDGALVAGAIGPLGKPLKPVGLVEPEAARAAFEEQAGALLAGGVDLFILETFADLEELRIAVEAVRSLSDLPIVAQKTFIEDAETLAEGLPQRVVSAVRAWGVAAVGANCTVGPQRMLQIVRGMAEAGGAVLSAMPTAGLPQLVDGAMTYDATPDYFARYGRLLAEAGAHIIGGCCGTTPAHIQALAEAVRGIAPRPRDTRRTAVLVAEPGVKARPAVEVRRSRLAEKVGRKYIVTVELDLPRGLDLSKVFEGASSLRAKGADCIDISDGARARLRMNPMVVSHLIQDKAGIEVMMHFSCRDRNLLAIQSDLLGAHALGLRNILAITGDPAQIGDYPTATSVFDVDSIGLVRILRQMNEGVDLAGNTIKEPTGFFIAVAFNPLATDRKKELDRLRQKVDEGAQLIYTQPIFELSVLEFAVGEAERLRTPLLVGILPPRNSRHAEFLHNEVPGILIPDAIRRRLAALPEEEARRFGIEAAQAFLREARPMTAGVYLMPPFGSHVVAEEVLKALD